jgi:hypothetical protein
VADASTPVAEAVTGTLDNIDEESLTVGATTVRRQRVQIAGAAAAEIARVMNSAPGGTEYGEVVRTVGTTIVQGQQSTLQSGTITTATSTVTNTGATNYNLATIAVTGTYAGVTAVFEGSPDGTNWFAIQGQQTDTGAAGTGFTTLTNTTRAWDVFIGAWTQIRVRATAWTSGTATILISMQTMPTEPVPTVVQGPAGTAAWATSDVASSATAAAAPSNAMVVGNGATSTTPAAATAGNLVGHLTDLLGRQVFWPFALPDSYGDANPAAIATATTTQLYAAAGTGLRWALTDVSVTNSHASVDCTVTISDAGGTIWQGFCAHGGGGFAIAFSKPKRQTNANAVVNVVTSAAANVLVSTGAVKTAT